MRLGCRLEPLLLLLLLLRRRRGRRSRRRRRLVLRRAWRRSRGRAAEVGEHLVRPRPAGHGLEESRRRPRERLHQVRRGPCCDTRYCVSSVMWKPRIGS